MGVLRLFKVVGLIAAGSLLFAGNAAANVDGFLKICKVGLDEATLGQSFTFTFAGQTVTVPAGTESGDFLSSCSQRYTLPAGEVAVTEQVPAGFELVSIRTLPPGEATLAGNVATVKIHAGLETTLIVRNRQVPGGHLKICKIGGDAATLGASFTFNVAGVGSFTVTAGGSDPLNCTARIAVPAGTVAVTEVVPSGFELVECHTIPAGRVSLSGNVATVSIVAGEETVLVCTNKSLKGNLQLCKKAGTGVTLGTPFTFTVTIGMTPPQTVTINAGQCVIFQNVPAGTPVQIVESAPAGGVMLASITCDPAAACTVDLANRRVTVMVPPGAGVTVEVNFTNEKPPGNLQLCKVAGPGVAPGTLFTFSVKIGAAAPTTVTVPAGQCVIFQSIPAGTVVEIVETVPAGVTLASIACDPAAACTVDLAAGRVTVVVPPGPGVSVEVNFTNKSEGKLKLCKVGGSGVPATMMFTFTVQVLPSGTPTTVSVAAGACIDVGVFPNSTVVQITETVPAGFEAPTIVVSPAAETRACPSPLPNRVCVHVSGGATTTVTVTNVVTPICTLTKGFFRNHPEAVAALIAELGGTLTVGGTALTAAQVQAILDATSGKPGSVTFASNSLLNLTQQLIAALLNLSANPALAPAEVQDAIADAQAGITITVGAGGQITIATSLSHDEVSSLIETLSAFNEGAFPGFPHCG